MQKITQEEFKKIATRKTNPITIALDELAVGEGLEVKKHEYKGKAGFSNFVDANFCKRTTKKKFKSRWLKDGTGWAVLRVK